MVLGSTQPLTETGTKGYLLVSKDGRCIVLTLQLSRADYLEILGTSPSKSYKGLFRPG